MPYNTCNLGNICTRMVCPFETLRGIPRNYGVYPGTEEIKPNMHCIRTVILYCDIETHA